MTEDTSKRSAEDTADKSVDQTKEAKVNAQDDTDLDALLDEFDTGSKASDPPADKVSEKKPTKSEQKPEADGELLDQVRQLVAANTQREQDEYNRRFDEDMGKVVKEVRGELDATLFDDTLVRAWIDAQAREHPKLADAWKNRHVDPKKFQRVVDQLGRDFTKKWSNLPDKQLTEDREAVTAAVRGASTKAPDEKAPDISRMSNAEYREYAMKTFGYIPQI